MFPPTGPFQPRFFGLTLPPVDYITAAETPPTPGLGQDDFDAFLSCDEDLCGTRSHDVSDSR